MIIDIHGHYTTPPKALEAWRNRQIAGIENPSAMPAADLRALDREQLVDARLVSVDGDTVQIAHEALIRVWPRLRGWLEDYFPAMAAAKKVAARAGH